MTDLRKAIVIGGSRGIGRALADELSGHGADVIVTVRRAPADDDRTFMVDLSDPEAGAKLLASVEPGSQDAVIISAGIMGPDHQDAALVDRPDAANLFWINAVAPVRLARRLLSLVRPGGLVAFMSSRTGSIALNDDGQMELYRSSKAALNSLAQSFAIKDALPLGVGVLLIHPGWVQTDMGGTSAPVTVADSVAGIHAVVRSALGRPECRFVDYQGSDLPW